MGLSLNEIRDRAIAFSREWEDVGSGDAEAKFDPSSMPPALEKAHQCLNNAVDAAYGKKSFATEAKRVAFLFKRYQELVTPLMT
jgi:hypothetical protein